MLRPQWITLGGVGLAAIAYGLAIGQYATAAFLLAVGGLYVLDQVRARVLVLEDEVVVIHVAWRRHIQRKSIEAIHFRHGFAASLATRAARLRVMLPLSTDESVAALADALGVPVVTESK